EFNDIIRDFSELENTLRTFYPDRTLKTPTYGTGDVVYYKNDRFREIRDQKLGIRESSRYQELWQNVRSLVD
ncbi:MAG: hypothetical protein ABEK50_11945, partial [bacterium]